MPTPDPFVRCFVAPRIWPVVIALTVTALLQLSLAGRALSGTADTSVSFPKSAAEVAAAIERVEACLAEPRLKAASTSSTGSQTAEVAALSATTDELAERDFALQQWRIALEQQLRYLRGLAETRHRNVAWAGEEESWHGFAEPATIVTAEQLTDEVSAQRLQLRTAVMLLPIFESEIARYATRLNAGRKELRLANDQAGQGGVSNPRQHWLLHLAQLKNDADEVAVETAELGRRAAWEALEGQRKRVEFLERKLATARDQARLSKSDLDGVLAQISGKRAVLQKELNAAITLDNQLRTARDAAVEKARAAKGETGIVLRAQAAVEQARVETSGQRVESLRGFLQLADYARTVWEDRLWATEPRAVRQVRAKRQQHQQVLEGLRQWKALMEQSLSALSDQVLRQALKAEDPRVPAAERDAAWLIHVALQERTEVELRAVGALAFAEDLTARLHAELSAQVAGTSVAGRLAFVFEEVGAFCRRVWHTELYIAEDSVIAGGQKVSVPRSITIGKVLIALTIFAVGLLAARWGCRLVRRIGLGWLGGEKHQVEVQAKAFAAVMIVLSLLVAMASVRIPWTVFAFLGGALAIGVGFGAQTLINNFISGVILLCERSIRVGDIVEVDEQRGKVVRMGFRNSLVSRGDGIEVLVPNSQFLEKKVVNWTLTNDLVRYSISVGVAYGAPPSKVTDLIAQAAAEHPHVIQHPEPDVLLEEFGDNALVFSLQFWMRLCPSVDGGVVRSELRHRIHALFDEAGISIAYPQRDIHLDAVKPLEIRVVGGTSLGTDNHRVRGLRALRGQGDLESHAVGEEV